MKKQLVIPAVAVALLSSAVIGGVVTASAEETQAKPENTLVNRLVERFGLKASDVQQVFDEEKAARIAEIKKSNEERLTQAVKDGKITEEQKQKILAKQQEMQAARDANKNAFSNLTKEEVRSKMEAERTALETWAKDNGIDMQYLMIFGHKKFVGHPGQHIPF